MNDSIPDFDLDKHWKEINTHNESLMAEFGFTHHDVVMLLDDANLTGKMEIVDTPQGDNQYEDRGIFTQTYVDQVSSGVSGDSYSGFIYGKIIDETWLKVPYEC